MAATIRPDYKVRRLRRDDIAQKADAWRKAGGKANEPYFDIVDFVETILKTRLPNADLRIDFFEAKANEDLAYVEFKPPARFGKRTITLNIDREIWELAKIGEPEARFIVAHEIGHIVLHDHEAKAFSDDDGSRLSQFEKEETAEWQADIFAICFLMPAHVVVAFGNVEELAAATAVEHRHAETRFQTVMAENSRSSQYSGYACRQCGEFTMFRQGIEMKCECGFSVLVC